jgi:hypothetical protein
MRVSRDWALGSQHRRFALSMLVLNQIFAIAANNGHLCLCATPEGSTPPSILANDYLMLPTLLFFVILADGGSTKYSGVE